MAPRAPESFEHFLTRLERSLAEGGTEVRFGQHHHTHALCTEDGVMRVRRLETSAEEAEAFRREHGIFMPEHAEQIGKPRTLVHEEPNIEAMTEWLRGRWPL